MVPMCTFRKLAVTSFALALAHGPGGGAGAWNDNLTFLDPPLGREWLWFVVVAVALVASVAMVLVARWQRKSLQRKLCLEISNQGNVPSRYELRADDPYGALKFQFALRGDRLPQQQVAETASVSEDPKIDKTVPSGLPASAGRVRQTAGLANVIAGALSTVGLLLPRSVGAPLLQAAGQLRRGQSTVKRAEQLPGRMGRLTSSVSSSHSPPKRRASSLPHTVLCTWVRTPLVEPGETLAVDLLIRPVRSRPDQFYPFTVFSRSAEQEKAPLAIKEGDVQIAGASWARRYSPFLIILATAVVVLTFVFWLASVGILGR